MTYNKTLATPHSHIRVLSNILRMLLLTVLAGLVLVVSASAQSSEAADIKTGNIVGKVVDTSDDPISAAHIVLQSPAGDRLTDTTKDDGSFKFLRIKAGLAYQITVTAEGYGDWNSSVTLEPGQEKVLIDIKLRILAIHRAVTVSYSSKEVAAQQLRAEEHQRILGFIPNVYVTYERHPEPLTTKMKFDMAYKDLTHPAFFVRVSLWAGVQQIRNSPSEWRQGADGYGKRLGAGLADAATGGLITNAILPSLLHQDPRYFYQGTGTKWSRAWHAISAPFVCKGDNGATQPNYSQLGGSLIAYSISSAYYPNSNRTARHIFGTFGIDMGMHVAGSLAQEFILDKFTRRHKRE